MPGFSVEVDKAQLKNVEKTLTGIKGGYTKVVVRALNKTITKVQKNAIKEIQKEITPTQKVIKKTFRLIRASYSSPKAAIRSTGGPIPLIHFKAKSVKKGVTAQVTKKGKRTLWPNAFIATMKNKKKKTNEIVEHKGVFSREKPPYGRYIYSNANKKSAWKKFGRKYRLPINEQFGPKVPGIMNKKKVMDSILKEAGNVLQKEIGAQLEVVLKGH